MGARQSSEADGADGSLSTVLGSAFCRNMCERDQDPDTVKINRAQQGVNADTLVKTRLAPPASRLASPTLQKRPEARHGTGSASPTRRTTSPHRKHSVSPSRTSPEGREHKNVTHEWDDLRSQIHRDNQHLQWMSERESESAPDALGKDHHSGHHNRRGRQLGGNLAAVEVREGATEGGSGDGAGTRKSSSSPSRLTRSERAAKLEGEIERSLRQSVSPTRLSKAEFKHVVNASLAQDDPSLGGVSMTAKVERDASKQACMDVCVCVLCICVCACVCVCVYIYTDIHIFIHFLIYRCT